MVRRPTSSRPSGMARRPTSSRPSGMVRRPTSSRPSGMVRRPTSSRPSGMARRPTSSRPSGMVRRPTSSKPSGTVRRPTASWPDKSPVPGVTRDRPPSNGLSKPSVPIRRFKSPPSNTPPRDWASPATGLNVGSARTSRTAPRWGEAPPTAPRKLAGDGKSAAPATDDDPDGGTRPGGAKLWMIWSRGSAPAWATAPETPCTTESKPVASASKLDSCMNPDREPMDITRLLTVDELLDDYR